MITVPTRPPFGAPLRKVLLIEDDRGQARIIEASFNNFVREKFELHWAATYEDGLTSLREGKFDACLLDYQLGPRSGLDLLREIGQLGIDTPVIFVTSETSGSIDEQAMQLGALDYLVKFELTPRSLERSLRYTIKQHVTLRELRRLVTRDQLTGLYNHHEGLNLLELEVERARKFSRSFTILLIDIDRFKEINAAYGEKVGDQTLVAIANSIRECTGESGVVVRWAADDFAVWLPHSDAVAGNRMAETILAEARKMNVTLSIGVASWHNARAGVPDLLTSVDRALAEAKAAGGNRVA
ncbi:MAG: GGDEF domain-containing protein [Rariglobus sp.]|nr:diguanylate cyclase [Rariglobus sp.]